MCFPLLAGVLDPVRASRSSSENVSSESGDPGFGNDVVLDRLENAADLLEPETSFSTLTFGTSRLGRPGSWPGEDLGLRVDVGFRWR